jgi:uracil-DNA glycosylase
MNPYWKDRGVPWEYDPGPPKNRKWPRLFAETPNYRQLSRAVLGKERFRWHFGPMFYRGRLQDNAVKVLIIGQEGAQDESLAHRAFTGGTGSRMQHFLNVLGITRSYLFLNTFVYPIFDQYDAPLRWLAQHPDSPIVQHRHELFNYVLERNDVHLVIAVGNAAKESVVTWVTSRGGSCPAGSSDVSQCAAEALGPHTRIVGVMHPGGAGQGGSVAAIIADFKRALETIKQWASDNPNWLLPDPDGARQLDQPYRYRSAPISFRDFACGVPWRLGHGGTASNRRDGQRSIQLFSAGGAYNNQGVSLRYTDSADGSPDGYADQPGDLPYEPPRILYREYDRGPVASMARLFMGGNAGLAWPDFEALGLRAHASFGFGPIYRGRPEQARILILADQQSHDDLFTGRALTGESGQQLQPYLEAIGILTRYVIIRVLPIDTLGEDPATVTAAVHHPQTEAMYQAIVDRIRAQRESPQLLLALGPHARDLAARLHVASLPVVSLKAWREAGALADWQAQLGVIRQINYEPETENPTFVYEGRHGQIPSFDLPFGTLRWQGSSGDRARQAIELPAQSDNFDYYKFTMPRWASQLSPAPLSPQEEAAINQAPL